MTTPAALTRSIEEADRDKLRGLLATPEVAAMLAVQERERARRRSDLQDERARLLASTSADLPPLQVAEAAAAAAVQKAERTLADARGALLDAQRKRSAARSSLDIRLDAAERALRELADDRIEAFLAELDEMERKTMAHRPEDHPLAYGPRGITGRRPAAFRSLRRQIAARLEAIRTAREAARALPLELAGADAIAARLEQLRASIPAVDESAAEYLEVEGGLGGREEALR